MVDGAGKICGLFDVHFAEIPEVVFALELTGGQTHAFDVKKVAVRLTYGEEVTIHTRDTIETGVK
jgi:hypothetical protein